MSEETVNVTKMRHSGRNANPCFYSHNTAAGLCASSIQHAMTSTPLVFWAVSKLHAHTGATPTSRIAGCHNLNDTIH
jgi:hypothetical protein